MDAVLKNAILAFLCSSRGGTLLDLRRFLLEPEFRADFLTSVPDPELLYYWQKGFPLLAGGKSVGPIITRLNDFLATTTIRCMVSQRDNRLDFAEIMDTGKIFLAKLPTGLVGEKDCHLLGALLVSKFQQVAMSRQAQRISARRDFWICADEFDNFITPSMAEILKGTRKYRVGLTLAHHELHQLQRDPDVASAVLSNASTRIVFRVGDEDARKLSEGFGSFEASDLRNLGTGEAIVRTERSEFDFNLTIPLPPEPGPAGVADVRARVITASRQKYAVPRAEVEAKLFQHLRPSESDRPSESPPSKAKRHKTEALESKPARVPSPAIPTTPVPESKAPPNFNGPAPDVPAAPSALPPSASKEKPERPEAGGSEAKFSEVPKAFPVGIEAGKPPEPTVAQPAVASGVSSSPPVITESEAPRDLGRGGELHRSIQIRLQSEANKLGLTAAREDRLTDKTLEAADLVLNKGSLSMAVEICVTTTTDHEFGNVNKCLAAGFARVAVVAVKRKTLQTIEAAVRAGLEPEKAAKVTYFTPDELIAEFKTLAATQPAVLRKRVVGSRERRRHGPELSPSKRKAIEAAALAVMRDTMNPS